jgi:crossover junction endodeoxyribonuclease RusA
MSGEPEFHYRLTVPATMPWLTANQRLGWWARARLTARWRQEAAWLARSAKLPALESAYVVVELRFPVLRRRDPGNWSPTAKAIVDGLVDAGVFVDDDAGRVVGPDMRLGPRSSVPVGLAVVHLWPVDAWGVR